MQEARERITVNRESTTQAGRDARQAESHILDTLRQRMGAEDFNRFIARDTKLCITPGRLEVGVPTRFMAEVLQQRFRGVLSEAAAASADAPNDVQVVIRVEQTARAAGGRDATASSPPELALTPARSATPAARLAHRSGDITLKHRLEDFVEGVSNRGALAIATAVADPNQETSYSPFVVHGPCGVGKTHLLQGIALRWMESSPRGRVKYTTAEAFTNEFMGALRTNRRDEFRQAHRGVKLLCIDDVHHLSNKRGTQDELLHTLDAVDLRGARIVIASDAHPAHIEKFSTALASRLVSGAVVAIAPPDEALRREIVRRVSLRRGLMLTDEAIEFLVSRSVGIAGAVSVREMEGLVLRVQAMRQFMPECEASDGVVGVSGVRRALGMVGDGLELRRPQRPVPVRAIESHVCRTLGVAVEAVRGKGRSRQVVLARWVTAFLSHKLTNESYPEIARAMGRPNHSSVITACRSLEKLLQSDPRVPCGEEQAPLRRVIDDIAQRVCREFGRV